MRRHAAAAHKLRGDGSFKQFGTAEGVWGVPSPPLDPALKRSLECTRPPPPPTVPRAGCAGLQIAGVSGLKEYDGMDTIHHAELFARDAVPDLTAWTVRVTEKGKSPVSDGISFALSPGSLAQYDRYFINLITVRVPLPPSPSACSALATKLQPALGQPVAEEGRHTPPPTSSQNSTVPQGWI